MSRGGIVALGAIAMGLAFACSAIVSPEDEPVHCALLEDGSDPCGAGELCIDGECRVVTCESAEICDDGRDNDCDGTVDEAVDVDGDGAGICGGVDCDDTDPGVHPGAIEECDGRDNDCDGRYDPDPDTLCGAGNVCLGGTCVSRSDCSFFPDLCRPALREFCDMLAVPPACRVEAMMGCVTTGCSPKERCNRETGLCERRPTLGGPCGADGDCMANQAVCVAAEAFNLGAGRICTAPCCTAADCPDGSVCWSPGNGARGCLPPETIGLAGPLPYTPCTHDCPGGGRCRPQRIPYGGGELTVLACGDPRGELPTGTYCPNDSWCQSGLCEDYNYVCTTPCGSTADCRPGTYCEFLETGGSRVPMCLAFDTPAAATTGTPCTYNDDCRDFACVSGRCADACCSHAHCTPDTRCRPVNFPRLGWLMYCV